MILSHTVEEFSFCPEITTYFTVSTTTCDVAINFAIRQPCVYSKVKSFTDKSDPKHCCYSAGICLLGNPQVGTLVRVRILCPSSCPPRDMAVFATPSNLEFTSSHSQSLDSSKHPCIEVDFLGLVRSIHQKHRDVRKTCCFGGACRIANWADTCLSSTKHLPFCADA